MNLFELASLIGMPIGALLGAMISVSWLPDGGLGGAMLGALIGSAVGWAGPPLLVAATADLAQRVVRLRRRRALVPHFGSYLAADRDQAWQEVKEQGHGPITGTVLGTVVGGLAVDPGLGFPALLPADAPGLLPGSAVEVHVLAWEDATREIRVGLAAVPWVMVAEAPLAPLLGPWPAQARAFAIPHVSGLLERVHAALARGESVPCVVVLGERRREGRIVARSGRLLRLALRP